MCTHLKKDSFLPVIKFNFYTENRPKNLFLKIPGKNSENLKKIIKILW